MIVVVLLCYSTVFNMESWQFKIEYLMSSPRTWIRPWALYVGLTTRTKLVEKRIKAVLRDNRRQASNTAFYTCSKIRTEIKISYSEMGHERTDQIDTTIQWRCPWCNGYRRRKWPQRHELESWTRLIAFHIALIPLVLRYESNYSPSNYG